jgi:CHRD domain-containing protein
MPLSQRAANPGGTLMTRPSLCFGILIGLAMMGLGACSRLESSGPKPAAGTASVFAAELSGREEVPPANSHGARGSARLEYDKASHVVTWNVGFGNLTSAATGAHVHGPADAGSNAGVVLTLTPRNMYPIVGPLQGSATLTDAQAADLMAGKWYVNIHTANNPNGELRGQLQAK